MKCGPLASARVVGPLATVGAADVNDVVVDGVMLATAVVLVGGALVEVTLGLGSGPDELGPGAVRVNDDIA